MDNEKDFVTVCEALTRLAILKNTSIEEKVIAVMSKTLLRDLSKEEILGSCEYLLKRVPRFPDIADFYNLIKPAQTPEDIAEREVSGLIEIIKGGYDNYKKSGTKMTDIQREILSTRGWDNLAAASVKDLEKIRTSLFYTLRNKMNQESGAKLIESKRAIASKTDLLS